MPTSSFQPIRLLGPGCKYKFTHLITKSVDPDQSASSEPTDLDLRYLQRQGISVFSRTRVNGSFTFVPNSVIFEPVRFQYEKSTGKMAVQREHCLQRQGMSGFNRTRVNLMLMYLSACFSNLLRRLLKNHFLFYFYFFFFCVCGFFFFFFLFIYFYFFNVFFFFAWRFS